jgi:hypothetical protein
MCAGFYDRCSRNLQVLAFLHGRDRDAHALADDIEPVIQLDDAQRPAGVDFDAV